MRSICFLLLSAPIVLSQEANLIFVVGPISKMMMDMFFVVYLDSVDPLEWMSPMLMLPDTLYDRKKFSVRMSLVFLPYYVFWGTVITIFTWLLTDQEMFLGSGTTACVQDCTAGMNC